MSERLEVSYGEAHWLNLSRLRGEAVKLMKPLAGIHVNCLAYGSIARGDVRPTSDVDVFVPSPPDPALMEAALERAGIRAESREIVQATPGYAAKGYVYTGERTGYSFPLTPLLPSEREFYSFAGSATLDDLAGWKRVPGVDKRLMLIEPTTAGHVESTIRGREGEVAHLLGVDTRIVMERVRTLDRREQVGRTGVYLKRVLAPDEGFGEALRELSLRRSFLRKRMR